MESPEDEGAGHESRAGRAGAAAEAEEDQSGPQGGGAEQCHGEDRGEQEAVEQVDGDPGPGQRQYRGHPVGRAPELAALEGERGREDGEGGPDRDHLVEVEPGPRLGDQEGDDEGDPDGVEQPGAAPPEEVGAAVAVVEQSEKQGQPDRDGGLENGRFALDQDGRGVHGSMLTREGGVGLGRGVAVGSWGGPSKYAVQALWLERHILRNQPAGSPWTP